MFNWSGIFDEHHDFERNTRRQKGLHKNDKVRIVRGMLAGKDGVVQEVDAKGHLKILVGKMVLKIDAADQATVCINRNEVRIPMQSVHVKVIGNAKSQLMLIGPDAFSEHR